MLANLSTKFLCFSRYSVQNTYLCNFFGVIMDSFSTFGLFRNLKIILGELNDSKHHGVEAVHELLKVYNNAKEKYAEHSGLKKYPLIILEGLDGSGKSAMTRNIAKKIQAEKWMTPPESIRSLRQFFDDDLVLRSAYYSLGNYIAALEVLCILTEKPVVMDRFWHSTTAFALAQGVANNPDKFTLPDAIDDIYKWPSDLLKPDIVFLLNVSEEIRLERHSRRNAASVTSQERLLKDDIKFRQDVIEAYKNMKDPSVVLINGDGTIKQTLNLLMEKIKPLIIK